MTLAVRLMAAALRWTSARRAAAFHDALRDTAAAQRKLLARIVAENRHTEYAQSLGLDAADDVDAFRRKAPIVDYAVLEPWIARQRCSTTAAITPGRVRCYEPTSGSERASKLIPYNDAMLATFRGMFAIWADDLLRHRLHPRSGRTFMSISPPTGQRGLADDSDYLGPIERALIGRLLVKPALDGISSTVELRDTLAHALLACADLEVVSVWNPSYLLVLMQHAQMRREALLPRLAPQRRKILERDSISWSDLWPSLQLVSCWDSAAAAAPARRLGELLPHATLQGKGLLATEAAISVPLTPAQGAVALVDATFIELEDAKGRVHLLHEAEGGDYAVIVTQRGGLLRYRLGDRVRVTGRYYDAPLLEFIGRTADVADLVGEKLAEGFVAEVLSALATPGAFCTLLPLAMQPARYRLLTDDPNPSLAQALDQRLAAAHRYGEARALGQLAPLDVVATPDMRLRVHEFYTKRGMSAGDIKDRVLQTSLPLAAVLDAFIAADQRAAK
jgi:GH3 auxin-responsive promoter